MHGTNEDRRGAVPHQPLSPKGRGEESPRSSTAPHPRPLSPRGRGEEINSMATVLEPAPRATAPERIRHPLQAVRATIRKYVLLESAALAVILLAAWFWIGLALDWGLFAIFSVDWILELQNLDESRS